MRDSIYWWKRTSNVMRMTKQDFLTFLCLEKRRQVEVHCSIAAKCCVYAVVSTFRLWPHKEDQPVSNRNMKSI